MTVKREVAELFEVPLNEISGFIEKVLTEKQRFYSFTKTNRSADDCFETVIKPIGWPFILSTKMIITFNEVENATEVVIQTTSQKWVFNDSFNMYNGYINKLLESLRKYS
ncbi:hypothetical protein [Colwellia sp. MB02u-14]|uniref:hypothetical protein n=1 Tax=Colwellia sp. MB02u-14 TaxID=2759815 RepID=UPI0015F76307|nr:hypothetical protein [Colwellia sp. MB02u-14]MBA6304671.1 hypothetical protein [Colwellia sp. MB02u-14]